MICWLCREDVEVSGLSCPSCLVDVRGDGSRPDRWQVNQVQATLALARATQRNTDAILKAVETQSKLLAFYLQGPNVH